MYRKRTGRIALPCGLKSGNDIPGRLWRMAPRFVGKPLARFLARRILFRPTCGEFGIRTCFIRPLLILWALEVFSDRSVQWSRKETLLQEMPEWENLTHFSDLEKSCRWMENTGLTLLGMKCRRWFWPTCFIRKSSRWFLRWN